jgi:GNAT superfamily N-acetyltransferase
MTGINRNGYTDLPAGHVAAIATFLEMRVPPVRSESSEPAELCLKRLNAPDPAAYRDMFRKVGTNWLWNSRLRLDDAALGDILGDPAVETYFPERDGAPIGILELDFRGLPSVEIAFFGLVPEAVGSGAGRWLMDRALQLAWRAGVNRVWLHTCTFDHPGALGFYLRSGFVPYERKVEMVPDPRLDGTLPRDAAPHVPLILEDRG